MHMQLHIKTASRTHDDPLSKGVLAVWQMGRPSVLALRQPPHSSFNAAHHPEASKCARTCKHMAISMARVFS